MMCSAKVALPNNSRKQFAPEAYAEFPLVPPAKVKAVRDRVAAQVAEDDWEVIEEVIGA